MLDELLIAAKEVSSQLLPILGVIVLVFLAVFLYKAIKLIEKLTESMKGVDTSVSLVNKSIEKVQAPLDTACKISNTVDKTFDQGVEACKKGVEYACNNAQNMKDYVNNIINKKDNDQSMGGNF